jgi:hypothetical protein
MKRKQRLRRKLGDIVSIPLGEGRVGFGWVLGEPLMAFFDYSNDSDQIPSVEKISQAPLAFRIWVMNHALTEGIWPVIGHAPIPDELATPPWFFKQDPLSRKVSITQTGAEEMPAENVQCEQLECAAIWEPDHVVDRLRDHFAGRSNKWVESMKIRH